MIKMPLKVNYKTTAVSKDSVYNNKYYGPTFGHSNGRGGNKLKILTANLVSLFLNMTNQMVLVVLQVVNSFMEDLTALFKRSKKSFF